jgi:hypothetical protein
LFAPSTAPFLLGSVKEFRADEIEVVWCEGCNDEGCCVLLLSSFVEGGGVNLVERFTAGGAGEAAGEDDGDVTVGVLSFLVSLILKGISFLTGNRKHMPLGKHNSCDDK